MVIGVVPGRLPITTRFAKRANEKEQAAKFIVNALFCICVQRLHHKNIPAPHVHERPGFMFAILELPFLVLT
ncbi:MAG: hypothetical protein AUK53_11125 [Betaproteobacteria bacterium CG2_30_59_46]|nr:MAG: hypothetical protein AUK53_11125 [Betaproteobacteria bacterium CG2_30_59_46]